MKIIINIPNDEFLDALGDGLDGGVIEFGVSGKSSKKGVRVAAKKRREAMSFILAPDDQEIVDYWNGNDFIKQVAAGKITDSRNRSVKDTDIGEVQKALRQASKSMSKDEIKAHLDKYFAFCMLGEHIWDGANHGYKNLGGLLRKLVNCNKSQELPWWEMDGLSDQKMNVHDPYPDITEIVALEYNREFMGVSLGLDITKHKEHKSFASVSLVISAIAETNLMPLSNPAEELAECLMKCVRDVCGELSTIYPANLVSENVLQKAFPQYLYENFGLPMSAMEGIVAAIKDATT